MNSWYGFADANATFAEQVARRQRGSTVRFVKPLALKALGTTLHVQARELVDPANRQRQMESSQEQDSRATADSSRSAVALTIAENASGEHRKGLV